MVAAGGPNERRPGVAELLNRFDAAFFHVRLNA
jgi:hypothetical protein